jgi:putative endonuclease
MWFVYILECIDGSLYTGMTSDLSRRVKEHMDGLGAKYTKSHPVRGCVYSEECPTRSAALKREAAIKQLPRKDKLILVSKGGNIEK